MIEYKGVAVPWVAVWSEEVPNPDDHPLMLTDARVRYRDEHEGDRDGQRVLWVRNRVARGQGVPLFAQVHADRQRNAMVTPRCQVCGLRMHNGHRFLLQEEMIYRFPKQGYIATATPPVCDPCLPIAVKLCPQLAKGALLRVVPTSIGMWGYLGDVANDDSTWIKGQRVSVSDPLIPRLLAKQVIVAMTEWTEEPWTCTSTATAT